MLFENIGILDENFDFATGKWVGVRDGRIDYIGDVAPADADSYGEAYDGAGCSCPRCTTPTLTRR